MRVQNTRDPCLTVLRPIRLSADHLCWMSWLYGAISVDYPSVTFRAPHLRLPAKKSSHHGQIGARHLSNGGAPHTSDDSQVALQSHVLRLLLHRELSKGHIQEINGSVLDRENSIRGGARLTGPGASSEPSRWSKSASAYPSSSSSPSSPVASSPSSSSSSSNKSSCHPYHTNHMTTRPLIT
jgi:hypothetical protein